MSDSKYVCPTCGKDFRGKIGLRRHMHLHTGDSPYQCGQCSASFGYIGNLKRHLRIHTGEKPFLCKECGRQFSDDSHRKSHEKIHLEELKTHAGSRLKVIGSLGDGEEDCNASSPDHDLHPLASSAAAASHRLRVLNRKPKRTLGVVPQLDVSASTGSDDLSAMSSSSSETSGDENNASDPNPLSKSPSHSSAALAVGPSDATYSDAQAISSAAALQSLRTAPSKEQPVVAASSIAQSSVASVAESATPSFQPNAGNMEDATPFMVSYVATPTGMYPMFVMMPKMQAGAQPSDCAGTPVAMPPAHPMAGTPSSASGLASMFMMMPNMFPMYGGAMPCAVPGFFPPSASAATFLSAGAQPPCLPAYNLQPRPLHHPANSA